jgi:hypothetical protein
LKERPEGNFAVTGKIGGLADPMNDKYALFVMTDRSFKADCSACYKKAPKITVQVNGPDGKVVKKTLAGFHGLKSQSEIVVEGEKNSDSTADNLIVDAAGVYLDKSLNP